MTIRLLEYKQECCFDAVDATHTRGVPSGNSHASSAASATPGCAAVCPETWQGLLSAVVANGC